MSVYRQYRCNLCGDYIEPTDRPGTKPGFGVHFTSSSGACSFKRPDEAERHICHQCAVGVHNELRKVMPATAAA